MKIMIMCIVLAAFAACPAQAQWQMNGIPVAEITTEERYPDVITDGAGGAIIVWQDTWKNTNNPDIYAQRLDGYGTLLWPGYGTAVCAAAFGQHKPQIVPDGAGGGIVAWIDGRTDTISLHAQRIDPEGNTRWQTDGVPICTADNSWGWWEDFNLEVLACDSGAILTWSDDRTGDWNIYAQRIDTSGALLWPVNGVAVCAATGGQTEPAIVSDGAGGCIIAWTDQRSGTADIYAQRIGSAGTMLWAEDGIPVCTHSGNQSAPAVTSNSENDAIVSWSDTRSDPLRDIYTQKIDGDGLPLWTAGGVAVCTDPSEVWWPKTCSDGMGGAYIAWYDRRNGVPPSYADGDIYAQRIDTGGNAVWMADGILLSDMPEDQNAPDIIPDGYGGAIIAWYCYGVYVGAPVERRAASDPVDRRGVYAQRLTAEGTRLWGDEAFVVSSEPAENIVKLAPDGTGGAYITWARDIGLDNSIYAQRLNGSGSLPPTHAAETPPAAFRLRNYPNPFNPSTNIVYGVSARTFISIRIYDTAGRLVRVLEEGSRAAGIYTTTWDGLDDRSRQVASGIYFCCLSGGTSHTIAKMVLLK